MAIFYSGRQIRVRFTNETDAEIFAAWASDPLFAYYQPLSWHTDDYKALWLWRHKTLQGVYPPLEYEVLVEDSDSGIPLGALMLTGVDQLNRKAEFSMYFATRRMGRCVSEALHVGLHSAFERLNLRKIICHFAPENDNARSILQSLSFVEEGYLSEELLDDRNRPRDLVRSVLLKNDWLAEKGPRSRLVGIAPLAESGFVG